MKTYTEDQIKDFAFKQLYDNKILNNKNVDCFVNGFKLAQEICKESLTDELKNFNEFYTSDSEDSWYGQLEKSYAYSGYNSLPSDVIDLIREYQEAAVRVQDVLNKLNQIKDKIKKSKHNCGIQSY
jgi:hypothetical protein